LDCDPNTGLSWRHNFPDSKHFEMWAHEFVALPGCLQRFIVDILHLSPPCQVFSPVHTREGKNDQQNFASLFACEEIIKKTRPRMITLEQTFGILHPRFKEAFHSLIQMFTSLGYSVSWRTLGFQRYGLPQSRRRLIIIAAA
jgi:DNA (cytosine-5)-methyltransferase 1